MYLKDTAYIGKYKLYRRNEYLDNYIPAIIPLDLFNQVQNIRKKCSKVNRHSKNTNTISIFSGILYCSVCKRRICAKTDNRVKRPFVRYCCDNSSRFKPGTNIRKCTNKHSIRETAIEEYLLNNIQNEAQKYIINYKIKISKPKNIDNSKEIKKLEKKIIKLKDLYLDDLIDKELYKKDYENYSKQILKLKANNNEIIEKNKDFSELEKLINSDITKIYNSLSKEKKRQFWLSIIDKIYLEGTEIKGIKFL